MTDVTITFTTPLCAMVNSTNLFDMVSMFFSLPLSAKTTTKRKFFYKYIYVETFNINISLIKKISNVKETM